MHAKLKERLNEHKKFLESDFECFDETCKNKDLTDLEIEHHNLVLAIKECTHRIEVAYQEYLNHDITKNQFEYRTSKNKIELYHWNKMLLVVTNELFKRAA